MSATPAVNRKQAGATSTTKSIKEIIGEPTQTDDSALVRLHITPFTPALLKSYIPPSVLPLAQNISYHTVETFPEKGFGYVELPKMEGAKLKKKLNGLTLKGSKVRIEEAKPEKRKAEQDADDVDEKAGKRVKREKRKKEQGVLEGAELPGDRKIKRGWTEPPTKNRKEKKDKNKDDDKKVKQKESKYTKEPELLFKAKLTPVAATEVARKEGKKKKDKKDKKKPKDEVIVHEFENNTKQPSFLKSTQVSTDPKPAVEYINGKGWVDEDGNVVEAETGKARNRRVLELVDPVPVQPPTDRLKSSSTPEAEVSRKSTSKVAKKSKKSNKEATPEPPSTESESGESSVVSSSSGEEESDSESDAGSNEKSSASSPAPAEGTPEIAFTPSSPAQEKKEVHPLEALFKRPKPSAISTPASTSTPVKGLAPINTAFSFFGNEDSMDIDGDASGNPPITPFTERDLEWRGLRSAAPTPDTAAIGRRFSFPWRKGSQEVDDDDDDDEDLEAGKQLTNNTKANASVKHLPGLLEEDEDEDEDRPAGAADLDEEENEDDANATPMGVRKGGKATAKDAEGEEEEESEFAKWFWENRGENNRAWKKRRRETLKSKRLRENKKLRRAG